MGYNAYANGQYSVAMGYNANAIPSDAIAIGDSASATGNGGIAIGMGSTSSGRGSGSIGLSNKISGNSSYVYGNGNNVGANNAFVLGNTVTVAAGNDGAVVLGNASAPGTYVQTTGATIRGTAYAFAGAPAAAAGTNPTVSVGAPGAERQITNVAAGELSATSTNAINGSQLYATNQALNAVTAVAGAGWNLSANGGAASNVAPGATVDVSGGASGNISVTQNGSNLVIDTNPSLTATSLTTGNTVVNNAGVTVNGGPNGAVSLTNTGLNNGGNTITNVGAGALSATSTDAVNGSQLYTTNQNVTTNATNISNLTNNINNGTIGLVQQVGGAPGNGTITVGAATGGTLIDVSGTSGSRVITGVGNGAINSTSTDAVNGSQLYAVSQVANAGWNLSANGGVASNVAPGATVDVSGGASGNISVTQNGTKLVIDTNPNLTASSLTTGNTVVNNTGVTVNGGPNGAVSLTNIGLNNGGNTITNVGAGSLSATSTDAVNGSQLYTTNQNVAGNTTAISNLTNNINNGTIGLVQQVGGAPGNGTITVGAATGGTLIDVSGTGGSRVITGVGNGAINSTSTDAVNGSQLYAVSQAINAGWDVASGATGNGVVTNTGAPANVAPGKSATFVAGNNLAIAQNGTTVAVAMQNDISLNSVTATTVNATTVNSTTVNADKISINNGPTISSGGIDAGGTRITNVSAGINQTDVVNVSQMTQGLTDILNKANNYTDSKFSQVEFDLRSVDRNARAGTASAMAIGMLPQAFEAGRGILSGAVTTNMGEQGFALGLSKASDNGRYIVKAAVSYNTRNQVAGGVAGGIQF